MSLCRPPAAPTGLRLPDSIAQFLRSRRQLSASLGQPPLRHQAQFLGEDPAGELGLAGLALQERDRHLDDAPSDIGDELGHIDLEAVTQRLHLAQIQAAQD